MHEILIWRTGGMTLKGETGYSEKNLFQCHFVHHKSHLDWSLIVNLGLHSGRLTTNCLSCGVALIVEAEGHRSVGATWQCQAP
jgi:hypothetical protein